MGASAEAFLEYYMTHFPLPGFKEFQFRSTSGVNAAFTLHSSSFQTFTGRLLNEPLILERGSIAIELSIGMLKSCL